MQCAYLYNKDQSPIMDTIYGWGERFQVQATLYPDKLFVAGDIVEVYSAGRGARQFVVIDADERTALLVVQ